MADRKEVEELFAAAPSGYLPGMLFRACWEEGSLALASSRYCWIRSSWLLLFTTAARPPMITPPKLSPSRAGRRGAAGR